MTTRLERYGTGSGIAFGAGVGGTAGALAGVGSDFGVVVAFGVIGGLVTGGFVGRFADGRREREDWATTTLTYAVGVGIVAVGRREEPADDDATTPPGGSTGST
jgi:hypothetical protein